MTPRLASKYDIYDIYDIYEIYMKYNKKCSLKSREHISSEARERYELPLDPMLDVSGVHTVLLLLV